MKDINEEYKRLLKAEVPQIKLGNSLKNSCFILGGAGGKTIPDRVRRNKKIRMFRRLKMGKEKQIERNCNNCKRQHTRYCPNSSECISLPNLPYFETDVIRLLEHDWDMHEKKIYELEAENDRLEMKLKQCIDEHSSMCDMNVGLMHDMENMKAENERIRNSTITQETFKVIVDEKDKEIAVLYRALMVSAKTSGNFTCEDYIKVAKKELEEQD